MGAGEVVELPGRGWQALGRVARDLDGRVRVALLTGLSSYACAPDPPEREWAPGLPPLLRPPVTVAVLEGDVAGPALALALVCDLRVVGAGAALTVAGDAAAAAALVPLLGRAAALELTLTGRPVPTPETVEDPLEHARRLAGALVALPREQAVDLTAVVRPRSAP